MPIRAILFDKDGTLVDIQATLGPTTCSFLRHLSGGDRRVFDHLAYITQVDTAAQRLLPGCPVISEATDAYGALWARALGRPLTGEFLNEIDAFFLEASLKSLQPIGDPASVVTALSARSYRLGVMTNDSEASARAQLSRFGIDGLIGFVAGYDSGFGQKPDARPVLAFAARAGVAPDEVAVVGDSPHDLIAARAAGAVAVAVLSGPNERGALEPLADVVLPSIMKLEDWLSGN